MIEYGTAVVAGLVLLIAAMLPATAMALQTSQTKVLGGLEWRSQKPAAQPRLDPCTDDAWVRDPSGFSAFSGPRAEITVNLTGVPGSVAEHLVEAVEAAATTWNDEGNDCDRADASQAAFSVAGTTEQIPVPDPDGLNTVLFSSGVCGSVKNVACFHPYSDPATGELLEWDVALDPSYPWGIGSGPFLDVQNVVTHELGHVVGLGHVDSPILGCGAEHMALTMYPCTWPGDLWKRTLGLGDALGVEEVTRDG